jgi:hypothetical protein
MAALIEGVLVADARWGIALRDSGGEPVRQVIWPHGFAGRVDGGRLALVDASGRVVAHVGDQVRIGGGETGSDGAWLACGDTVVVDGG